MANQLMKISVIFILNYNFQLAVQNFGQTRAIFFLTFNHLFLIFRMSSVARKRKTKGASLWSSVLAQGDGPQEFDPGCPGNLSQYFCETCDKDLKTEEQLKQHFSEHIPCAYPGCKFNAHFLVIEKHIRMAHANGIGAISLETEEEIRKWREERKKNYPTKQKIAEKKAEIQLKMIRGMPFGSKHLLM